jgi:predicted porin
MKKSLFAIAAVTAFAGAAQAQSSVTVYGLLDLGYVGANERVTGTAAQGTLKTQNNQFGQSAQSTSRLGFRGTEDLGGGMSALFTIEMGITPNSNPAGTTAGIFSNTRNAFVGLRQKGVGQFAVGVQNTPVFNAIGRTDPGQLNNIAGNVLTGTSTGLGANSNVASGANAATVATRPAALSSNVDGNSNAYTQRLSNMLTVQSETYAGFRANAFYALNNQNSTETTTGSSAVAGVGGVVNSNAYGAGIDYTWKKLLLTANYQSIKAENNTVTTSVAVGTTGSVTVTNGTDAQMYFGGMYDFGIIKAYAGYLDRKFTSGFNSNNNISRNAQQIGVRGNWTPKVESWASIGSGKVSASGIAAATANFNGWQLGSNYILSKRTNLYAIYGQEQTSSTSVGSYGLSNYGVGVRHTF